MERIPLARPSIGDGEIAGVERVLRSGWLTRGPEVERFEAELAGVCGRRYAVAVSSGTAALELSFWALDIGAGDRVLVTAFGFPAAANALSARGAVPVAVDVEAASWTVDLEAARRAAAGARALVAIDQLGAVTDAAALAAFAADTGVPVIADAACGLGGRDAGGEPGGKGGLLATFSFHPRKAITTGEGGAIAGDDEALAETLRQLRNHGQAGPGRFGRVGTNARLSDVAAAIGCAQLSRLDALQRERALLAAGYRERLAPVRDRGRLSWQIVAGSAEHAYQSFAVLLAPDVERAAVIAALDAAGIDSGPATYAFPHTGLHAAAEVPVAAALHERALALPLYSGMRSAELDRVAAALSEAVS